MKVNIQMFLPGPGILHCCNYRARTGMMIGPETSLARGKLQYIPRYPGKTDISKSPTGAAETSQQTVLGQGPGAKGSRWSRSRLPWLHIVMADVRNDSCLGRRPLALQEDK